MMSWPDFAYKQIIVHQIRDRGEKIRFRADNIVIIDADEKVLLQHTCHRLFALFVIVHDDGASQECRQVRVPGHSHGI